MRLERIFASIMGRPLSLPQVMVTVDPAHDLPTPTLVAIASSRRRHPPPTISAPA